MKLSILDQSIISSNQTAQDALHNSMILAKMGEKFGYSRYWIAEHHDIPGLALSSTGNYVKLYRGQHKNHSDWFRSRFVATLQTIQSG